MGTGVETSNHKTPEIDICAPSLLYAVQHFVILRSVQHILNDGVYRREQGVHKSRDVGTRFRKHSPAARSSRTPPSALWLCSFAWHITQAARRVKALTCPQPTSVRTGQGEALPFRATFRRTRFRASQIPQWPEVLKDLDVDAVNSARRTLSFPGCAVVHTDSRTAYQAFPQVSWRCDPGYMELSQRLREGGRDTAAPLVGFAGSKWPGEAQHTATRSRRRVDLMNIVLTYHNLSEPQGLCRRPIRGPAG